MIFGPAKNDLSLDMNFDSDMFLEQCIYDEVSKLPQEKIQEFVNSERCATLLQEGKISKRTIVRLNKIDDLERRTGMAALQIAKDNDDPLFAKLVTNRIKEKELLEKIKNKYHNKAMKAAKVGQKDFLKNALSVGFMRR